MRVRRKTGYGIIELMAIPTRPTIYEINTVVFLNEISQAQGRTVTLATVPESAWDDLAKLPIDTVWLMGVWQRSPAARQLAGNDPSLKKTLPDLRPSDIAGSAYSIYDYKVDERLGGNKGLAVAREQLRKRGIYLILDYVPNHVAIDHPWTNEHADYFLPGTDEELQNGPGAFVRRPVGVIAKGKDPNFEPWSDVAQLNAFSPSLRRAVIGTLKDVSDMCDGVRCDMAMLMMNDVFAKTWGARADAPPTKDYWPTVTSAVRAHNPNFLFLAEVYWGKEQALLEQGFTLCYDKELYDDLLHGTAQRVQRHLRLPIDYQSRLLRFIENHDEPRAAAMPDKQHFAAAVAMATLPGARLFHEGQLDGRKIRVPVHLVRRPHEPQRPGIQRFYASLLETLQHIDLGKGEWAVCWPTTYMRLPSRELIGWRWKIGDEHIVVVINYSDKAARGRLRLPKEMRKLNGAELLGSKTNPVHVQKLLRGKAIRLQPWQYSVIKLEAARA